MNLKTISTIITITALAYLVTACAGAQTTPIPTTVPVPSPTSVPPTFTLIPATSTSESPSSTPLPPTATDIPPTRTKRPTATLTPIPSVIIFEIGEEDNGYDEYTSIGFTEPLEYTCTVGVDCTTETFPEAMCIESICQGGPFNTEVQLITINFVLDQDYDELVLRLARAGRETSVVTVDGEETYEITNGMLHSNENWIVGGYDLILGSLEQGPHYIQFSVKDDGRGNGTFGWDALRLFAR